MATRFKFTTRKRGGGEYWTTDYFSIKGAWPFGTLHDTRPTTFFFLLLDDTKQRTSGERELLHTNVGTSHPVEINLHTLLFYMFVGKFISDDLDLFNLGSLKLISVSN